jgi:hypothetical protein
MNNIYTDQLSLLHSLIPVNNFYFCVPGGRHKCRFFHDHDDALIIISESFQILLGAAQ